MKSVSDLSEIEISPSESNNLHKITRSASERFKKEGNYEKLQNVTLVLLWLCMGCSRWNLKEVLQRISLHIVMIICRLMINGLDITSYTFMVVLFL